MTSTAILRMEMMSRARQLVRALQAFHSHASLATRGPLLVYLRQELMTVGIIMFADLLFSRNCVGVGICDCCDGSDEVFNPRSNCTNVCEANLMGLKKQALSMHRNIQAGMRVRTEVVEAFKLSRSKDAKQVETLKTEYDALDRILFRMMFLLQVGILQLTNARFARELTRRSVCMCRKRRPRKPPCSSPYYGSGSTAVAWATCSPVTSSGRASSKRMNFSTR
jgi:hypothetical protein